MNELANTVEAKSDQLNAIDLASGPRLIKITGVNTTDPEKPSISFEGDEGKPWKPSKGMRRLMLLLWGEEKSIVGRQVVVFRDPGVVYAGEKVGGIVISHASGITSTQRHVLAVSRGKTRLFTVEPLSAYKPAKQPPKTPAQLDPADELTQQAQELGAYSPIQDVELAGVFAGKEAALLTYLRTVKKAELTSLSELTAEQVAKLKQNQAAILAAIS